MAMAIAVEGGSVAPFAGAWIEIFRPPAALIASESLPSRERGLKLSLVISYLVYVASLPSRERGLK